MNHRRRKGPREKDLTGRFFSGDFDVDRVDSNERFSDRSAARQQNRIENTAQLRADNAELALDPNLPVGIVSQVYSLHSQVLFGSVPCLCVVRKTLSKLSETGIVVGDRVQVTFVPTLDESGARQGVIEKILPRQTILTRTDSFQARRSHPIVANAQQMLIVVSLLRPRVKWGLVDRMIVAAQSGGLQPIICVNKIDLTNQMKEADRAQSDQLIEHYESLGIAMFRTSVSESIGIGALRAMLNEKTTVLAGHSGVGKSSLIAAIAPEKEVRIGQVSDVTEKGRHTTTSARAYALDERTTIIDTPGVKLFGLWQVTSSNLIDYFPDVANQTAPSARAESYARILDSLSGRK